jgi:hypothetical protein
MLGFSGNTWMLFGLSRRRALALLRRIRGLGLRPLGIPLARVLLSGLVARLTIELLHSWFSFL